MMSVVVPHRFNTRSDAGLKSFLWEAACVGLSNFQLQRYMCRPVYHTIACCTSRVSLVSVCSDLPQITAHSCQAAEPCQDLFMYTIEARPQHAWQHPRWVLLLVSDV